MSIEGSNVAAVPVSGGPGPDLAQVRKDRVPLRQVIPWSTHGVTTAAMTLLIGYFTIYATDTLRLNPAIVGVLLVVTKIFDAVGALLSGYVIDRAPETRFGKARPFELILIACWGAAALTFSVPGGVGDVAKYIWLFVSYILLTAVFLPLYAANVPLYTARVFPRRELYSDVNAKSGILGVLFAIVIGIAMPLAIQAAGKDPAGWSLVAVCIAVPATIIGLVRFFVFRESPDAAEIATEPVRLRDIFLVLRTNKYIWALSAMAVVAGASSGVSAGTYYFRYIVGNIGLQSLASVAYIALIPVLLFFPMLVRKFSVSRLIAASSFVGAAGMLLMMFAGDNMAIIMVALILGGFAWLPFSLLAPILIIDNATFNEYQGNRRLESVGGAFFSFANTLGAALAAGVLGLVLSITHYNGGGANQSEVATHGIVALNSWIPGGFAIVTGVIALFYNRLEHRIKAISAEVVARRQGDHDAGLPGPTESVRIVRKESSGRIRFRKRHHD